MGFTNKSFSSNCSLENNFIICITRYDAINVKYTCGVGKDIYNEFETANFLRFFTN